jgi:hypothetical protein
MRWRVHYAGNYNCKGEELDIAAIIARFLREVTAKEEVLVVAFVFTLVLVFALGGSTFPISRASENCTSRILWTK